MLHSTLVLLLATSHLTLSSPFQGNQAVLEVETSPEFLDANAHVEYPVDNDILLALKTHSDPVAALLSLRPETAAELAQPRLLHVSGEKIAEWMTEGDKMRLRRDGKKFVDVTDHEDFYAQQVNALAGKARKCVLNPDL